MKTYVTSFKRKSVQKVKTFQDFKDLLKKQEVEVVPQYSVQTFENKTPYHASPWVERNRIRCIMDKLEKDLRMLNRTYPNASKQEHFTTFQIPKASGGMRTINAPSEELKAEHNNIRRRIKETLKVLAHDKAFAYINNRSIKDALIRHQMNESNWFLKVDIAGFFNACTEDTITYQLSRVYPFYEHPGMTAELAKFAVLNNELPQGTPLSPDLTNWIMVPFDHTFDTWCKSKGFMYTRYADDILISHKDSFDFKEVVQKIEQLFISQSYPFKIKEEKTRYGSRKGQNWNLGLMLNANNDITLGHEFKKRMKVLLYQTAEGVIPNKDPHVIGLFNYLKQIEPAYYSYLNSYAISKYRLDIKGIIQ